ncbi:polysaccharide deacetylase family protein [Erythrobacter sp. HL-111]|uniref:polysaccharide deacetylase family protein n=1 Tax=Erythrobacter sp. HL-111 TaxID=1798193 RepID=UPI0006DB3C2E|nr:polysaccharide deacetylase family protein [Erythrobacter sp. HL-111]KPP92889.1 MAG: putative xylanase/chitin deacetylase [Erythrobacteraceae bacterium HL-111]SDT00387.1 Peptidoglycan/xylan/chitin deacetylase, PgdA/CDA1 family [Erythrobacter sp. HL-111]
MTRVYITIDTEYSSGLMTGPGPADRAENYARSIACLTPDGPAGITHKLRLLAEHGQRAVFFVDPMPALVWGVAAIEDVVAPILEAGQDVQLHCHTEWLEIAGAASLLAPVGTGRNIADFPFEEQCAILSWARDTLVAAGAPAPVAFRAGNYGANDDTLRALAAIGLRYDTSHCPALPGASRIALGPEDRDPVLRHGVIEVPVGSIGTHGGGQRHAQITALSLAEMTSAIRHARDSGSACFTLVSHSFELINRRRLAVNRIVRRRFNALCRELAAMRGVETATYAQNPPEPAPAPGAIEPLPAHPVRTGLRVAEQLVSNTLYGAL